MIDEYIAKLPSVEPCEPLACVERQKDVDKPLNERVRREKYYVWRLLEYAIKLSLGADASRLNFTKGENRRWYCEGFEFSLSHSGEALAVAISDRPVGVDIERIRVRSAERIAEHILTVDERAEYDKVLPKAQDKWLIRRWCKKEAIFKSQNKDVFHPTEIETAEFFCDVRELSIEGEKYILACAATLEDDVRVFENIELV